MNIDKISSDAFKNAREDALRANLSIVERKGDTLVRTFPDGSDEFIKDLVTERRELKKQLWDRWQECREENWDGFDAPSIGQKAYLEAYQLICLLPKYIEDPEIYPANTTDGSFSFVWYDITPGNYHSLDIIIAGNGEYTWNYFQSVNGEILEDEKGVEKTKDGITPRVDIRIQIVNGHE